MLLDLEERQMTYVHYGCGLTAPPEWLNFDASPTLLFERLPLVGRFVRKNAQRFPTNVRYGNIVRGLPLPDGSADAVIASHVLEHLSRSDSDIALRQTFQLLRPGGVFRLVVPDLEVRARRYVKLIAEEATDANDHFLRSTRLGLESRSLIRSLGNSQHLWMWDYPSMEAALARAGFIRIRRCAFGDASDPMFTKVEERDRFFADGAPELAVEGVKP
jgi:SAM-dependent methyltransferase